jgi:error-prone DNA polymerase
LANLAAIGAFASLGGTRRQALWQVEALGRSGPLFNGAESLASPSPLPEMNDAEAMAADFRGTGMSTGPHPMSFIRDELDREGIVRAADLGNVPDGQRARVAGIVVVRQRPGTAKGFVFLTIEDETGFANAIVTPRLFESQRSTIVTASAILIEGVVQNQDGVISLKADRFEALQGRLGAIDVSRDFH